MSHPLTTSQESPNSLPPIRYTIDQLADYILRQLGSPVFTVEITKQQVLDTINDSLQLYSLWRPRIKYGAVTLVRGQSAYLTGVDLGETGPAQVFFVQRTPVPQELFWGNLIDVTPLLLTGVDSYDMFLRWQKTAARVMSITPDWFYDEISKTLFIHNPIDRYQCGVVAYVSYDNVVNLDRYGADWVKQHAFQKSRLAYAEIMSKYSGAIPGPVKDLQLDTNKRSLAQVEVDKLETTLKGAMISTPIQTD